MARLNEPAAPVETIDSLKRKFMRQNRDIARANSTQSLRIRNLENETSRLLAENLGLREQILRLQTELENGRAQRIADHTGIIKSQLEAKLLEINALITGLGDESAPKKKSSRAGKITRSSPNTSPDQKNWKNMCTLGEAVGGQEGRLPPILENKLFPRRTLERQEILNLVADAEVDTTDSPEIGPPPVSQFVDENPVKIDLPKRTSKDEIEELSGLDPTLSINLEQRRKRKDGAGSSESRRASKVEGSHVREATGSLKTGAKRKLSVRDDDEPNLPVPPSSPDDFKYTRVVNEDKAKNKLLPQTEKPAGRITRELAVARGAPREKSTASTAATRKVLAPKSVNDSPKKNSKGLILDDVKSAKGEALKSNVVKERKERRPDSVNVQTSIEPIIRSVEVQTEPETPAAPDIFSPSSSQPSTARESRDTPPPPDLGPGTDGQRPSRRARPAVSYAEPNLRDKMRRPTKELVDAVSKDEKSHRGSFVKLEEDAPSTTVTIKAEPEADDDWKRMPAASSDTVENSPLSSKAPISDTLPSSITTHRKRRESILSQAEADLSRTSSGSAIAALLAENRRAKAAAREKAKENEAAKDKVKEEEATVTKAISKLDIYEFRGSSPNPEDALSKSAKEEKPNSRVSRRLSSVPKDGAAQSESEASDMEGPRKTEGSTSRRRQSTLGLRNSSSTTELGKGLETEKTLKRANSTTGIADSASRSDRISARRRSMML